MRKVLTLASRELSGYFLSPMAYLIVALFLVFASIVVFSGLSVPPFNIDAIFQPGGQASLRPLFTVMGWAMVVVAPLLTMRLLSEEYRSGTIEPLMTAPVTETQIVLGKFLAVFGFYLVLLATTVVYLLLLIAFGEPDGGVAAMGYLGLVLAGAAFLAVGLFASALTAYQILAGLLGIAMLGALLVLTQLLVMYGPEPVSQVAARLSAMNYFDDFSRGLFDTRGVVFFLSATALFLFLSVKTLELRRWAG
jgi:ABC-2 type transport system permease protein